MDLPSMSGGISSPAMSRMVGARSMFSTMWGLLGKVIDVIKELRLELGALRLRKKRESI